jgi:hypothetical protein
MKKINIYKTLLVSACAFITLGTTSCDDFLTIYPSNEITEEQFWEDRTDLESGIRGCWKQFISQDIMERMVVWGECRSDNFDLMTESWDDMKDLMNANLLETNSLFNWSAFYKTINFCNKVLQYGPLVVERDKSFTSEDWKPVEAEMKALRALNYFYLVRTFREIPFEFNPIGSEHDVKEHSGRQFMAEVVLDSIINDVEAVKDNGMRQYTNELDNKGRFTRESIYTLLADMYLWRAAKNASPDSVAKYGSKSQDDYQKVIEYCDAVLDMYMERYDRDNPMGGGTSSENNENPYHLIRMNANGGTQDVVDDVYDEIFVQKNSRESILELQFDGSTNSNTCLYNYRDYNGLYRHRDNNTGLLQASAPCQTVTRNIDNTSGLFSQSDIRRWQSLVYTEAGQRVYSIGKYTYQSITHDNLEDNSEGTENTFIPTGSFRSNWIIYRLSDVLLMKAEAITRLDAPTTEQLQDAFNCVTMILYRANPSVTTDRDKLSFTDYQEPSQLFDLVMRERRREFFGEGKRWFDLVRMAEHDGTTTNMLTLLLTKYATNTNAVRAKLASMNSLYSPVYENELKVNPNLHQNPAWEKEETIERN